MLVIPEQSNPFSVGRAGRGEVLMSSGEWEFQHLDIHGQLKSAFGALCCLQGKICLLVEAFLECLTCSNLWQEREVRREITHSWNTQARGRNWGCWIWSVLETLSPPVFSRPLELLSFLFINWHYLLTLINAVFILVLLNLEAFTIYKIYFFYL